MKVTVLGKGCARCEQLSALVRDVADAMGLEITLEKVTDLDAIVDAGVTTTPALMIDDEVICQGKVPRRSAVEDWLRPGLTSGA